MTRLKSRSLVLVPTAALLLLATTGTAHAEGVGDYVSLETAPDLPEIVGGQPATACQWPSVTAMTGNGGICSGTLVHPEVVLYAAHCPTVSSVRFSESAYGGAAQVVPVDHCMRYGAGQVVGDDDYAYCKLAYPVNDVPLTPVAYGCEVNEIQIGTDVAISGFGQNDQGNAGTKYWAATTVSGGNGTTSAINVGGNGTSAWQGDSGGPALARMSDGTWRAFGIVSGGSGPGQPVLYVNMAYTVPWVESNSGVDITPCFSQDGIWTPGPTCGAFSKEPLQGGSWTSWCQGQELGGFSATCGPAWSPEGDDVAPVVSIVSPVDGDQFDAPANVDINIDASDEGYGIRHVWISINGQDLESFDSSEPYGFPGANFPEGGYTLVAYAEDVSGNVGVSAAVNIGVGNEPPPSGDSGGGEEGGEDGGNAGGETGGGLGEDGGAGADEGDKGCACDVKDSPAGGQVTALGLLMLLGLRRRRRA